MQHARCGGFKVTAGSRLLVFRWHLPRVLLPLPRSLPPAVLVAGALPLQHQRSGCSCKVVTRASLCFCLSPLQLSIVGRHASASCIAVPARTSLLKSLPRLQMAHLGSCAAELHARRVSCAAASTSAPAAAPQADWRKRAKPIPSGGTYPAQEHCSNCGLCDTYYVAKVKEACAFLGPGEKDLCTSRLSLCMFGVVLRSTACRHVQDR